MTYKEARVYLDEMSKYGSVLGLDTIRGLLRELGNPQESLRFIHIAGTNGKGSVLAYTSTILSEAGYRTGRYVSPTVISYLERIQVDGTWISEEMFAQMTSQVRDAIARLEEGNEVLPTVFEAETAIAFLYFKEMKCDLVVLEAGLGGALDATNIIRNTLCAVFSAISRDHLGVIGNTLEEITENKAGIIKKGCTVISAEQMPSVTELLKTRAAQKGCPFIEAEPKKAVIHRADYRGMELSYKEYPHLTTSLSGTYQTDNLCTALEVIRFLNANRYPVSTQAVRNGTEHTLWQGRFTCIGTAPVFILDGAHNEAAAQRLKETVGNYFPGKRLIFIMGVFRDKEYDRIAEIMCPLASSVYTVALPDKKRGLPPGELAETVRRYCPAVTAVTDGSDDMDMAAAATGRSSGAATAASDRNNSAAAADRHDSISKAVAMAMAEAEKEDVILAFGSLSYLRQAEAAHADAAARARNRAAALGGPGWKTDDKQREETFMIDQQKIEQAVRLMLEGIGEDVTREGLRETPSRIARMCEELFGGINEDAKEHLSRTFSVDTSEMVIERDITFYSMCEHHVLPFYGKAHIAYIPDGKVVGLSKLARTVEVFARRLQVQEQLTGQIADALMEHMQPKGALVMIEAEHMCMTMRGIKKPGSRTVTLAKRGVFETEPALEERFFRMMQR